MANPWAGEVRLVLDGQPQTAKLTLGALAELEAELATGTLIDLVQRFETGGYSARDVLALVVAGLRGGGWRGAAVDLLTVEIEGGPHAAARAAAMLLVRAFGAGEDAAARQRAMTTATAKTALAPSRPGTAG
jgi:hypothetical protein